MVTAFLSSNQVNCHSIPHAGDSHTARACHRQRDAAGRVPGLGILQATDWWLLLLAGAIFTVVLLCITQAYRIAVVIVVARFEHVYILWANLVGYLIFTDVPGPRTLVGGAVIVTCGCCIILREREQRGRAAAAGK